MNLILLRHGITQWNIDERLQGSSDVPLTDEGRRQAERMANHLDAISFDRVISSPLQRAYETAALATRNKYTITTDTNLVERGFGVLEGLPYVKANEFLPTPSFMDSWQYTTHKPTGGESLEDVVKRTEAVWENIQSQHKNATSILIVSHGVTLRCLVSTVLSIPLTQAGKLSMDNTSLTMLEVLTQHAPRISIHNYLSHL